MTRSYVQIQDPLPVPSLVALMAHDDTLKGDRARLGLTEVRRDGVANRTGLAVWFMREDGTEVSLAYDMPSVVSALWNITPYSVQGTVEMPPWRKDQ